MRCRWKRRRCARPYPTVQSIDGEFDAHVGVDDLTTVRAGSDARRFGDKCEAVVPSQSTRGLMVAC